MPCYQSNVISLKFDPKNESILKRTADELGYRVEKTAEGHVLTDKAGGGDIRIVNGVATGSVYSVNQLRTTYANVVLQQAKQMAKQKGWMVQQTASGKVILQKGGVL